MKHNRVTTAETRLPSAPILPNLMLPAVLYDELSSINIQMIVILG